MAQVVNEPPGAVDAVVQIKEEVDGELRWSEPTHCTIQLPTVASEPDIPVDITFQPTEDDQTPSAEVNTQYSANHCWLTPRYPALNMAASLAGLEGNLLILRILMDFNCTFFSCTSNNHM